MLEQKKELLKNLRHDVNGLDKKIVALLEERFSKARSIGNLKKDLGYELHSPERENDIFKNILAANTKNISHSALKNIYRVILDESLYVQQENK